MASTGYGTETQEMAANSIENTPSLSDILSGLRSEMENVNFYRDIPEDLKDKDNHFKNDIDEKNMDAAESLISKSGYEPKLLDRIDSLTDAIDKMSCSLLQMFGASVSGGQDPIDSRDWHSDGTLDDFRSSLGIFMAAPGFTDEVKDSVSNLKEKLDNIVNVKQTILQEDNPRQFINDVYNEYRSLASKVDNLERFVSSSDIWSKLSEYANAANDVVRDTVYDRTDDAGLRQMADEGFFKIDSSYNIITPFHIGLNGRIESGLAGTMQPLIREDFVKLIGLINDINGARREDGTLVEDNKYVIDSATTDLAADVVALGDNNYDFDNENEKAVSSLMDAFCHAFAIPDEETVQNVIDKISGNVEDIEKKEERTDINREDDTDKGTDSKADKGTDGPFVSSSDMDSRQRTFEAEFHGRSIVWRDTGNSTVDRFIEHRNTYINKDVFSPTYRRNTFFQYNEMRALISAHNAGVVINGKIPTAFDCFISVTNFLNSNIIESVLMGVLRGLLDKPEDSKDFVDQKEAEPPVPDNDIASTDVDPVTDKDMPKEEYADTMEKTLDDLSGFKEDDRSEPAATEESQNARDIEFPEDNDNLETQADSDFMRDGTDIPQNDHDIETQSNESNDSGMENSNEPDILPDSDVESPNGSDIITSDIYENVVEQTGPDSIASADETAGAVSDVDTNIGTDNAASGLEASLSDQDYDIPNDDDDDRIEIQDDIYETPVTEIGYLDNDSKKENAEIVSDAVASIQGVSQPTSDNKVDAAAETLSSMDNVSRTVANENGDTETDVMASENGTSESTSDVDADADVMTSENSVLESTPDMDADADVMLSENTVLESTSVDDMDAVAMSSVDDPSQITSDNTIQISDSYIDSVISSLSDMIFEKLLPPDLESMLEFGDIWYDTPLSVDDGVQMTLDEMKNSGIDVTTILADSFVSVITNPYLADSVDMERAAGFLSCVNAYTDDLSSFIDRVGTGVENNSIYVDASGFLQDLFSAYDDLQNLRMQSLSEMEASPSYSTYDNVCSQFLEDSTDIISRSVDTLTDMEPIQNDGVSAPDIDFDYVQQAEQQDLISYPEQDMNPYDMPDSADYDDSDMSAFDHDNSIALLDVVSIE